MRRLLYIIICLALIGCPGFFAAADDPCAGDGADCGLPVEVAPDVVYDWDELEEWLDDHWRTGGTVHLGADIFITGISSIDVAFYASDKVHIETGPYGFVVDRILYIGANIEITGNGDQTPVILVRDGGILHIDWVEYDEMALITVTGDGGTGVKLEEGAQYVCGPWSFMSYKALGSGSVAIDSAVYLELPNHYIDACGQGARGIVSETQVDMLLSRVTSDGASVTAPAVTLDTCVVAPEVTEATVINRKITSVGPRFYPHDQIPAGSEQSGYFAQVNMFCIILLSAEGLEDFDIYAYVDFDDSQMDYDMPGRYYLPPALPLPAPYDIFSFNFEEAPATYPVTIYDPDLPMFLDFYYSFWTGEYVVSHIYSGDEFLTLWRSDDEGETWYVFWKQDDEDTEGFSIWADFGFIDFYISDTSILSAPAWFAYEVGSGKGSDVLYIDLEHMVVEECVGGDRDGGDRLMRPWEFFLGGGEDGQQGGQQDGDGLPAGKDPPPYYYDDYPYFPGQAVVQGDFLVSIGGGQPDDDSQIQGGQLIDDDPVSDPDAELLLDDGTPAPETIQAASSPGRTAVASSSTPGTQDQSEYLILESDNPIPLSSEPLSPEDVAGEEDAGAEKAPTITGWVPGAATLPEYAPPALPDAFLTGTGVTEQAESGSPLLLMAIAASVAGLGGGAGVLLTMRRRMFRK